MKKRNDPSNPDADVTWDFILNPTSNPSTLIGTSNYSYQFAKGECFWNVFAPANTPASSNAEIVVSYKTIWNTPSGPAPAGKAEIMVGTSGTPYKYGTFAYTPPYGAQTDLETTGTEYFPITQGDYLSSVQVEDLVNSGNQDDSSMEIDITSIYMTN